MAQRLIHLLLVGLEAVRGGGQLCEESGHVGSTVARDGLELVVGVVCDTYECLDSYVILHFGLSAGRLSSVEGVFSSR